MAEEESSGRAVQDVPVGLLREPKSLLYSVDARIGGYGRDSECTRESSPR